MNESAARDLLLLRAYETSGATGWGDADREAAAREALQAVGEGASGEAYLAARAQAGLQRLATRDSLLAQRRATSPAGAAGLAVLGAAVGAFVLGLAVDHIGSGQSINLLAPPVWALLAWNLAVYALLLVGALRAPAAPGRLRRRLLATWRRWRGPGVPAEDGGAAPAWQCFAADWAEASLPLQTSRLAMALHLAAATLALGVLAGMYLRGLVLDYRVGWQSTFLDAASVQALLGTLLAPASALSGIALPDAAALQALRSPQPGAGASAAPWIHLYALTLLLWVVLPRLLLALLAGLRATRLRRRFPLALDDPYFQRLLRQQHGSSLPVRVWPHARAPDAHATAALRRLVAGAFGNGATLHLAPTVAYGGEDEPAERADGTGLRLVLCDLGATPEPESQGRLLRALAVPGAPTPWLLLDESAFAQRFGPASPRLEERRRAWRVLAQAAAGGAVFADLRSADLSAAEQALQAADPGTTAAAAAR
jgi:hypothetical protein